jgi:hypothetical protein
MNDIDLFRVLDRDVRSNTITLDDALHTITTIDFTSFSLEDMEVVEQADWLPDDVCVNALRAFLEAQDANLVQIRSYLTVTSVVSAPLLGDFIDAVFVPQHRLNLDIENVIQLLATAGGSRPFENPVVLELIKAETDSESALKNCFLQDMFHGDPSKFFRSSPKQNPIFIVGLPSFMEIAVTSYTMQAPPKKEGMKSWTLQGSNDKENWMGLANEVDNMQLMDPGAVVVFPLPEKSPPFRWFKVTQKDINHGKTLSIVLSMFDLSGEVRLVPNQ